MSVKLIVFDMAGTTVHDEMFVSKAVAEAMQQFGYPVQPIEVQPIMGYEKPLAIKMLLQKHAAPEAITPEHISEIHVAFVKAMKNFYQTSSDVKPLNGIEPILQQIQEKGIQVGLDTGFSKDIAEIIVERLGWLDKGLVQHVVGSDEVPAGRPHPFMIQKIMEQAGIHSSQEVVKVGDTEVDVNEGKNANCLFSIAVTTGAYTREALEPYHPDFIIDHMDELLPLLEPHLG